MIRIYELSALTRLMVVGGFPTLEVTSEVELYLSAAMPYELIRFQNLALIPCEILREGESVLFNLTYA